MFNSADELTQEEREDALRVIGLTLSDLALAEGMSMSGAVPPRHRDTTRTALEVSDPLDISPVVLPASDKLACVALRRATSDQMAANIMNRLSEMQPHAHQRLRTEDEHAKLPVELRRTLDSFEHSRLEPEPARRPPPRWNGPGGGLLTMSGHGLKDSLVHAYDQPIVTYLAPDDRSYITRPLYPKTDAQINHILHVDPLGRSLYQLWTRSGRHVRKNGRMSEAIMAQAISSAINNFYLSRTPYAWNVKDNRHGKAEWAIFRKLEDAPNGVANYYSGYSGSGVVFGNPIFVGEYVRYDTETTLARLSAGVPTPEAAAVASVTANLTLASLSPSAATNFRTRYPTAAPLATAALSGTAAAAVYASGQVVLQSSARKDLNLGAARRLGETDGGAGAGPVLQRAQQEDAQLEDLLTSLECGAPWGHCAEECGHCSDVPRPCMPSMRCTLLCDRPGDESHAGGGIHGLRCQAAAEQHKIDTRVALAARASSNSSAVVQAAQVAHEDLQAATPEEEQNIQQCLVRLAPAVRAKYNELVAGLPLSVQSSVPRDLDRAQMAALCTSEDLPQQSRDYSNLVKGYLSTGMDKALGRLELPRLTYWHSSIGERGQVLRGKVCTRTAFALALRVAFESEASASSL